jgi:ATPase subunit of ABC transporter with duplicated ATPase domains
VLDALLETVPVTPGEARGYLARFLFRGDDAFKEVALLSGGERSRLELALLGVMPSNVYLLDEPTNHLDVVAREAIESFLIETPATMLVVSHDRRFLDTVCERLLGGRRRRSRAVRRRVSRLARRRVRTAGTVAGGARAGRRSALHGGGRVARPKGDGPG